MRNIFSTSGNTGNGEKVADNSRQTKHTGISFDSIQNIIVSFGPDYAEKRRRMGTGGRFCRSDNAPQDGDSAGAAGVGHIRRHPAPNAGPRHPPVFAISNPATEAEDDPGQSTSETSGSQFTI